ncbi:MAG: C-GCAxxG-C-C family protein [Bacteroidales bacterium]|nr:C-GCAxxG-C-C family protein [Bacteroidales bacterium]
MTESNMCAIPEDFSVEERQARAESFFLEGYNCNQAVLLAFADLLGGVDDRTLKLIGSGMGGGVGRLREVCGAVSAMAMVAGFLSPADRPAALEARSANYALVQKMAARFREEKGSIVCREILGLRAGHTDAPHPSERTPEYYRTRPCTANVGLAARIVAEAVLELAESMEHNSGAI